jgi:orotate phosphoribosyltransferase
MAHVTEGVCLADVLLTKLANRVFAAKSLHALLTTTGFDRRSALATPLIRDGERGGNRTFNLLIKSQLLCQLSYAPEFNILAPDSSVATGIPLSFEIRLMHLLPTHDEVVRVLRDTGALRRGHFVYLNGLHSNEYLQVPLAMRYYQHAKTLSVGLSRLLRRDSELRAMIPELSIVAPATGGLPVAYGVCEALQAKRVYWAEREPDGGTPASSQPLHFRQFIEPLPGEQVVLVDDILRSGTRLTQMKTLLESYGAIVVALAVVVYQPNPKTPDFGSLPLLHLARLEASYYADAASCDLCKKSIPLEKVWV